MYDIDGGGGKEHGEEFFYSERAHTLRANKIK
jgi:hypothetical protein